MIEAKHIDKSFGKHQVLKDVSLLAKYGEITTLVGPNGSGKTTLLSIMSGLLRPQEGETYTSKGSIRKEDVRKDISFIPDTDQIPQVLTGAEFVHFVAKSRGISQGLTKERIKALSQYWDIEKDLNKLISSYSHGMTKKISFIAGLVFDPEIIILDEPLNGLDPEMVILTENLLRGLAGKGKTILCTSHYLKSVESISDKLYVMHQGKIVFSGQSQDFISKYQGKSIEESWLNLLEISDQKNEELAEIFSQFGM
jgi:ABC-2 type transport system ATP-binding protein